jgi:hypothetical protein
MMCSASAHTAASAPTNAPPSTNLTAFVGTWHGRDEQMLIELSRDGQWRWWNLQDQSGRPSEPPFMNGKWFIHEGDLYLRIDHHKEGGAHGFTPGMAMVFKPKTASEEAIHLRRPGAEEEIVWKRVAEPHDPADASQPARSLTNRSPAAAGSQR